MFWPYHSALGAHKNMQKEQPSSSEPNSFGWGLGYRSVTLKQNHH